MLSVLSSSTFWPWYLFSLEWHTGCVQIQEISEETPKQIKEFSQNKFCAKDVQLAKLRGTLGLLETPALM